ncbi:Dimeric dihydrodiol dehydrogenase, partial [Operophtera brumata]
MICNDFVNAVNSYPDKGDMVIVAVAARDKSKAAAFAKQHNIPQSGKHVLCEKPLCLNFKQAQSLINLAKKKKLFLMEAVWSRFSPAYKALEKEIESGKLGDIKFVEFIFKEEPKKVTALGELNADGVDLVDTVVLEYEGGRRAVLNINAKLKLWNNAT